MMNLILKTIGISLVLTIAGCANTGTNNTASLGAADDTPACCGSAACKAKKTACGTDCTKPCCASKASLGAADDAPSCASSCSTACKAKCDANAKAKMQKAKMKGSSLGAFDDAAKTKASCCPGGNADAGGCPFSGKKN
jgi:uncharacterized lipoprotein NlpE involved in copper resistance